VIGDEVAADLAGAITFARTFGLKWLELRGQAAGRRHYYHAPLSEVRAAAAMLRDAGIGVSFLNTRLMKWHYPGTETDAVAGQEWLDGYKKYNTSARELFDGQMDEVKGAIERSHILGVKKIRVFAFVRLRDPLAFLPRVADVLAPMAELSKREQCQLLVENEPTTNVVTGTEIAELLKLVPSDGLGLNWDPHNTIKFEPPFPNGYRHIPKHRIGNVQIKARSLLVSDEYMDWAHMAARLQQDGYRGFYGLEPHMGSDAEGLLNAKRALARLFTVLDIT
jgi:sugar phosphate isomerase/epimerase